MKPGRIIPVGLPACTLRGPIRRVADMSFRLHDADPIGVAMDWLEICKRRPVMALAELYAETAVFECGCEFPGSFSVATGY